MLHRPDQQGAPSASLSPSSTSTTPTLSFVASSSSSPPSTSRASTLDTSSLFIPRRRPPPTSNLRAPLNSRNATATATGKASYSALRRVSAPGGDMKTTMTAFRKGNGKLLGGGGEGDGDGDAMLDLQSEMDGVSLHHQQHHQHHRQDLAAPSSSDSRHELAVDIKRRLFNDGPPSQLVQAHAPWQASTSPEGKHDLTRSPVRRISQAQTQKGARDSPPRMGILTRSKVSRTGSVRISDAPQRRGSSSNTVGGPYHDGNLNGTKHSNGSEARGGAGVALPGNRSSPRCSPLRARGRGRAATPYPGEIAQSQAHSEALPAGSTPSSSASPSLRPPQSQLQHEDPASLLSSSPLSHSLSSSYPSSNTRPSTSTILLSHVESSSLQRAHFLSERAKEEERTLLRGLEMCTGLGRRLGGWEGGSGRRGGGQEGEGVGEGDGEGEGLVVKSRPGGRDRWVLATGNSAIGDGDEDLQYWQHLHLQAGISGLGENGEAAEGEDQGLDYAHEEDPEDEDLFGDGNGNEDRDELFDLDDEDDDDLHIDDGERGKHRGLVDARSQGRGMEMGMGMDAVHESFDEDEDEEYSVQEEEEEEGWSR